MYYPNVLYNTARKYNNAYILVEINDIGEQVANILFHELEYGNLLSTAVSGTEQRLGGGFANRTQIGVKTTKSVKKVGCSTLKDVIENNKLIVEDYDYIFELSNFVARKNSYEADEGYNDDLVMCSVLFSWLIRQDYFKELTDIDVRKRLYEENQRMIEEDLLPFGLHDDGQPDDGVVDFEDIWVQTGNKIH